MDNEYQACDFALYLLSLGRCLAEGIMKEVSNGRADDPGAITATAPDAVIASKGIHVHQA